MTTLPRNTRSVPTSCAMSSGNYESTAPKEHVERPSRRYVAIPHVLLEVQMRPPDRAVLISLLSFQPFAWDTLLSGRRLEFVRKGDEVAARAGISVRSLASSVRRLTKLGLVRSQARGRLATKWEVLPNAFGLADDDLERRRRARSTRRRYIAVPFRLVGAMNPTELGMLLEILEACGSRPYSRLDAGEQLIATITERHLCQRTGVSIRSAKRALCSLVDRGLIEADCHRGRWVVEIPAVTFGIAGNRPLSADMPNSSVEVDRFAEQEASLLHVHEGNEDLRGARRRAAAIYPVLLAVVYGGSPSVTTPSMRGRVSQSSLRLALAGSFAAEIERIGWRLTREGAKPPRPEAVVDAVLDELAQRTARQSEELRFSAAPATRLVSQPGELTPIPSATMNLLGDLERRAVRWQAELENGDPSTSEWRQLLGGGLPWESSYVPLVVRGIEESSCAR